MDSGLCTMKVTGLHQPPCRTSPGRGGTPTPSPSQPAHPTSSCTRKRPFTDENKTDTPSTTGGDPPTPRTRGRADHPSQKNTGWGEVPPRPPPPCRKKGGSLQGNVMDSPTGIHQETHIADCGTFRSRRGRGGGGIPHLSPWGRGGWYPSGKKLAGGRYP
ncbi:MAG: hypothetical protein A4E34_02014 [Methanoregula sp. PtaU1.Bin006]|nr:MAG: hypothetical protein A4E33_02204 [Methanoregula sp. PtaB.Bin085]OPY33309.1 MAG: hypothetical protein A4E34_02014 [Methanoregula sp. PtaU1.Bin006]